MKATYTPNFDDPRIRRRCKSALGFAIGCLREDEPKQWWTRQIDKNFGCNTRDLSKYLRGLLMICISDSFSMNNGQCKTYVSRPEGITFLKTQLNTKTKKIKETIETDDELVIGWANSRFQDQLESGEFEYHDKSDRLWNPIQNIKTEMREQLLASHGMKFQYDIETAAPTLLYGHSRLMPDVYDKKGKMLRCGNDQIMEYIEYYLANKTEVRNRIALQADIPLDVAKKIITALFSGGSLTVNEKSKIFASVGYDIAKMQFLKQDAFLIGLREDIKTLWWYLRPALPMTTKTNDKGNTRSTQMSSRNKWNLYFSLEREAMDLVKEYLVAKNIKHFLEHDGWSCDKEIDQQDLLDHIKQHMHIDLKLKHKEIQSLVLQTSDNLTKS